jgi:acetyl-CoA C-acetyltransferase
MSKAWIVDAVRTPRGRGKAGKGALSGIHPQALLSQTLNALEKRSGIAPKDVEDVVVGCVSQAGEQGANIARNAILDAGWPEEVTGVTLNRFCGSGLQAVNFAAMGVMSGEQGVAVGGGVESMSRAPMGSDGAGIDGGNELLRKKVFQVPQGISADLIATLEGFSREDVDRFALASQKKAGAAQAEGRFKRSGIRSPSAATPRSPRSVTSTPRGTRAASSTARPSCSSPPTTSWKRMASSLARAYGRRPPSVPSPSLC